MDVNVELNMELISKLYMDGILDLVERKEYSILAGIKEELKTFIEIIEASDDAPRRNRIDR